MQHFSFSELNDVPIKFWRDCGGVWNN